MKKIILFIILYKLIVTAEAATYYVATNGNDANPGTPASPWKTLQKAANSVSAGDVVYVMGGTYNQRVTITRSGNANNYITFAANPGQTVTIDGTGISLGSWGGLIRIDGGSYIKISGFRVIKSSYAAIMISGGNPSNIIIEKNYINGAFSSGIYAEKASNITIDSNEVTGAHTASQGTHNEIISVVQVNGFEVKNNYVHDNAGTESINAKIGSSNGKIHHNNVKPVASAGIYLDAYTGFEQNIEVFSNIIHDGPGGSRGIAVAVEGGGTIKNIKIYNNIVYKNGANGIVVDYYKNCGNDPGTPCLSGTIDNIQIVGNTVYQNNSIGWEGGIVNKYDKATNIIIRNNIVSQNNKAQISVTGTGNTIQNNLIDGTGGTTGSNFVSGNPLFVNPASGDFHIQASSPAIDKGYAAGIPYNTDYDGKPRPNGNAYDIGAYEYGTPVQSPYNGPHHIPGIVQAEDFDNGGEGLSYHDLSAANAGGQYRTTDVDIAACSEGGYLVGWMDAGEWLEYTVIVDSTAKYTINSRIASLVSGSTFHIEIDGTNITNQVSAPNTGSWTNWSMATVNNVSLVKGQHIMKIYFDNKDGFDLSYIEFKIQGISTGVKEILSDEFISIYPNPFSSQINIRYLLEASSEVTLVIYDTMGKRVGILVNEEQHAGEYNRTFEIEERKGIYFLQLTVNGKVYTKKLIQTE